MRLETKILRLLRDRDCSAEKITGIIMAPRKKVMEVLDYLVDMGILKLVSTKEGDWVFTRRS